MFWYIIIKLKGGIIIKNNANIQEKFTNYFLKNKIEHQFVLKNENTKIIHNFSFYLPKLNFDIFIFDATKYKEVKIDNKNLNIVATISEGSNSSKKYLFKGYNKWFPKEYEKALRPFLWIIYSKSANFQKNHIKGLKVVSDLTLEQCLDSNL